jgi:hypothetical protein
MASPVCQAEKCPTAIGPGDVMCRSHWTMVPPSLRDSIIATRIPGGEPSKEHLAYLRAAVADVAHKEKRQRKTPASALRARGRCVSAPTAPATSVRVHGRGSHPAPRSASPANAAVSDSSAPTPPAQGRPSSTSSVAQTGTQRSGRSTRSGLKPSTGSTAHATPKRHMTNPGGCQALCDTKDAAANAPDTRAAAAAVIHWPSSTTRVRTRTCASSPGGHRTASNTL